MSEKSFVVPVSSSPPVKPVQEIASKGLTSDEAHARLAKDGPNAMQDTSAHPLRNALAKFWAPVPWLLEASIVLEVVLHKYYEAAVIAALLVFNAALAYFQEGRAQASVITLNPAIGDRVKSGHREKAEDVIVLPCRRVDLQDGQWRVDVQTL